MKLVYQERKRTYPRDEPFAHVKAYIPEANDPQIGIIELQTGIPQDDDTWKTKYTMITDNVNQPAVTRLAIKMLDEAYEKLTKPK